MKEMEEISEILALNSPLTWRVTREDSDALNKLLN
jgi:hypothetical protein